MSFQGKKNRYTCRKCSCSFVTIDRDAGTTPFITGCGSPICDGVAFSEMYEVDQGLEATHEWFRASDADMAMKGRPRRIVQHHEMGGLFLRKINP